MVDIFSYLGLSGETVRGMAIISNWVSAVLTFLIAFAVTPDAGFRCPRAFLRLVQRVLGCFLSISLAYLAAYLMADVDRVPAGPAMLVDIGFLLVVSISAIRHLSLAQPIPKSNSWAGAWRAMQDHRHHHGRKRRLVSVGR